MASMQEEGFYCILEEQMPGVQRSIYCGLCLASSVVGIAGASWQVFQWKGLLKSYRRRRKPSANPILVLSLATSNILACLGAIFRGAMMLMTNPPVLDGSSTTHRPLNGEMSLIVTGHIVELLNQYFYGTTIMWTIIYALDIRLQVVNVDMCATGITLVLRYTFSHILIFVVMIGNPLIYVSCTRKIDDRIRHSGIMNNFNQCVMAALKKKFLAVIVVFAICWLPNALDAVILIISAAVGAAPASLARFYPIWAIEAILNPLQGLLNSLPYGRHTLFRRIAQDEGIMHYTSNVREDTPILHKRENLSISE